MRKTLIILSLLLTIGCNAQEPDICTYSEEYVQNLIQSYTDSLNALKSQINDIQINCDSIIQANTDTITDLRETITGLMQDSSVAIQYDSIYYSVNWSQTLNYIDVIQDTNLVRIVLEPSKAKFYIRKENTFLEQFEYNFLNMFKFYQ